jgi:hypothetical protein
VCADGRALPPYTDSKFTANAAPAQQQEQDERLLQAGASPRQTARHANDGGIEGYRAGEVRLDSRCGAAHYQVP